MSELLIRRVSDFEVNGRGDNAAWHATEWLPLERVGGAATYPTRAKVVWSQRGLYFLVECEDARLTCTMTEDNDHIYKEDVVEIFFQTDLRYPVYFEYEISPLGVELPLLVSNNNGPFHGWLPFGYKGDRCTRRATSVQGGKKASKATCKSWTAEFFIPFRLLVGMSNVPPKPGTAWRGNLYRIDYDSGAASQWAWCTKTGTNFHDYKNFAEWRFA